MARRPDSAARFYVRKTSDAYDFSYAETPHGKTAHPHWRVYDRAGLCRVVREFCPMQSNGYDHAEHSAHALAERLNRDYG